MIIDLCKRHRDEGQVPAAAAERRQSSLATIIDTLDFAQQTKSIQAVLSNRVIDVLNAL